MSFMIPGMILNTVPPPEEDPIGLAIEEARLSGQIINERGEIVREASAESTQDYYLPPPTGPEGLSDEVLMNDPEVQEFWRRWAQPQVSEEARMLFNHPREVLNLFIFDGNEARLPSVISDINLSPAEFKAIARSYAEAFQSTELMEQRLEGLYQLLQQLSGLPKEQKIQLLTELRTAWLDIDKLSDWSQSSFDKTRETRYSIQEMVGSGLLVLFLFAAQDPDLADSPIKLILQVDLAKRSGEMEALFPTEVFDEDTVTAVRELFESEQLRQKNLNILTAWKAYAQDGYVASQDRYLSLGSGILAVLTPGTHEEGMEEINEYWKVEKEIIARVEQKLVNEEVTTISQALLAICREERENSNEDSKIYIRANWLQSERSARLIKGEVRGHLIDFGESLKVDPTTSRRLLDETYHLQAVEKCNGYSYTVYRLVMNDTLEQEMWDTNQRALDLLDTVQSDEITTHEVVYAFADRFQQLGAGVVFYIMPFSWATRAGTAATSGLQKIIQSEKLSALVGRGVEGAVTLGVASAENGLDTLLTANPDTL